jgi:hypothetical protein
MTSRQNNNDPDDAYGQFTDEEKRMIRRQFLMNTGYRTPEEFTDDELYTHAVKVMYAYGLDLGMRTANVFLYIKGWRARCRKHRDMAMKALNAGTYT